MFNHLRARERCAPSGFDPAAGPRSAFDETALVARCLTRALQPRLRLGIAQSRPWTIRCIRLPRLCAAGSNACLMQHARHQAWARTGLCDSMLTTGNSARTQRACSIVVASKSGYATADPEASPTSVLAM